MILQSCEALTPAFATQTLRAREALRSGEVTDVVCSEDTFGGYVARIARVTLRYSADAASSLPPSLILKLSKPDLHPELLNAGRHEVEFYRAMQSQPQSVSIPVTYSAE